MHRLTSQTVVVEVASVPDPSLDTVLGLVEHRVDALTGILNILVGDVERTEGRIVGLWVQ